LEVQLLTKGHAVVAQSTLRSQSVQNTLILGPLLEVEMLKSSHCDGATRIFKGKNETHHVRTTFARSIAVAGAMDSAPCQG